MLSSNCYASYLEQKNNVERPDLVEKTVQIFKENFGPHCSGTMISEDGLILTAAHCLMRSAANEFNIRIPSHAIMKAKVIKTYLPRSWDEIRKSLQLCMSKNGSLSEEEYDLAYQSCIPTIGDDLAILQVISEPGSFKFATICEKDPNIGDEVFSINYPDGILNQSVGTRIEGDGLEVLGGFGITVTAFIDGGSSGGSLFDKNGQVCGITNSQKDNEQNIATAGVASSIPHIKQKYGLKCFNKIECFQK
jgi:S1-C subfamily serine protease